MPRDVAGLDIVNYPCRCSQGKSEVHLRLPVQVKFKGFTSTGSMKQFDVIMMLEQGVAQSCVFFITSQT